MQSSGRTHPLKILSQLGTIDLGEMGKMGKMHIFLWPQCMHASTAWDSRYASVSEQYLSATDLVSRAACRAAAIVRAPTTPSLRVAVDRNQSEW